MGPWDDAGVARSRGLPFARRARLSTTSPCCANPRRSAPAPGRRIIEASSQPAQRAEGGRKDYSIILIWTLGTIAVFVRSDTLSRDRRRPLERTLIMFARTHGKPHTETYRFSATPTLSDFPLLIGEMVRLSDLRFKRQAQRRSLFQKIRASWAIRSTPKQEF
jgi:hypothetical protein